MSLEDHQDGHENWNTIIVPDAQDLGELRNKYPHGDEEILIRSIRDSGTQGRLPALVGVTKVVSRSVVSNFGLPMSGSKKLPNTSQPTLQDGSSPFSSTLGVLPEDLVSTLFSTEAALGGPFTSFEHGMQCIQKEGIRMFLARLRQEKRVDLTEYIGLLGDIAFSNKDFPEYKSYAAAEIFLYLLGHRPIFSQLSIEEQREQILAFGELQNGYLCYLQSTGGSLYLYNGNKQITSLGMLEAIKISEGGTSEQDFWNWFQKLSIPFYHPDDIHCLLWEICTTIKELNLKLTDITELQKYWPHIRWKKINEGGSSDMSFILGKPIHKMKDSDWEDIRRKLVDFERTNYTEGSGAIHIRRGLEPNDPKNSA